MKNISILGSTGSIGRNTLEVVQNLEQKFRVMGMAAGRNFELFCQQVEIACQGGASGFLAGRAIWQEAISIDKAKERIKFLATVGADRLKKLNEIAAKYATPWYKKLGLTGGELAPTAEGWYQEY